MINVISLSLEPNNTVHFIIILLVKTVVKMLNIYAGK